MTTTLNPATGAEVSHWYCVETTQGTTPTSPVWKPLRYTSGNMKPAKDSLQSSELDGSREIADIRLGSAQVPGEISIELSYGAYNDLLEGALGGTFAQASALSSLTLTLTFGSSTTPAITRSSGSWVTDGVKVGDLVRITGFVNAINNEVYQVIKVGTLGLQINSRGNTLVNETSVAGCGLVFPYKLGVGSTRRSFSILTKMDDADSGAGEFHITRGVEITGYSFNIATNSLVTGKLSTLGLTYDADATEPSGSTYSSVAKTTPYSNVDANIIDSTLASTTVAATNVGYITSMDVSLDNAASVQFVVGNDNGAFIERGRATSKISLSAFFFDSTLYSRFINETEVGLSAAMFSDDGNNGFTFGRCIYTSGAPEIGGEGSITQGLEAQAMVGAAGESSVVIQYAANP